MKEENIKQCVPELTLIYVDRLINKIVDYWNK